MEKFIIIGLHNPMLIIVSSQDDAWLYANASIKTDRILDSIPALIPA